MTSSSLLSKFLGQHQGGAGTRGSEVVTTASVYQSTVCQNTTDVVRKAMHPARWSANVTLSGHSLLALRVPFIAQCKRQENPDDRPREDAQMTSSSILACKKWAEMSNTTKHAFAPRSPVAHIAIISPKTSNASVPYVTSSLAAPVSEAAMFLHRKSFDAVVAPSAWREVCRPMSRACSFVRDNWNFSERACGSSSTSAEKWAGAQCRLCIPSIAHSIPTEAISSRDFDLLLSRPARVLSKVQPASSRQEKESTGAGDRCHTHGCRAASEPLLVLKCSRCATSSQKRSGSRSLHEAWRAREYSRTRLQEQRALRLLAAPACRCKPALLDLVLTPSTLTSAV